MVGILFVCLGNICRSPLAEGVFRDRAAKAGLREGLTGDIWVDSAGTGAYHIGAAPDPRSIATARKYDIDISDLRGRRINDQDFKQFDYILAMDKENLASLKKICPPEYQDRIQLFLPFARDLKGVVEVPDPYFHGDMEIFERVYDFIDRAATGFLHELVQRHFADRVKTGRQTANQEMGPL